MKRKISKVMTVLSVLAICSCTIVNDTDVPESLEFEAAQIQYRIWGGWISSSHLEVDSSGVVYVSLGYSKPNNVRVGTYNLSEDQQNELRYLLAYMPSYERFYEPEVYLADGNTQELVLSYKGKIDTVGIYNGGGARTPPMLRRTMALFETIRLSVIK